MVFYRKYRPQTIDELDNKNARESLSSILSSGKDIHAFLFKGPKGLGKTSSARIVAKVLNCTGNVKEKPCNKCDQCIAITKGTSLDVIEIDGASNRGIDQIRDLKERIKLSPAGGKKKVYIIDEVHMLTQEAFDALLKTLEEPPSHVVFILCTTESQKIPATIASRCFEISFSRATPEELVRSLDRIAKGEKIKIDKDALLAIAERSDGSFRDAAKIIEELSVYAKGAVTRQAIEEKYQSKNVNNLAESFLKALRDKNAKEALSIISSLEKEGTDIKYFIEKTLEILHESLLSSLGFLEKGDLGFTLSEVKEIAQALGGAYLQIKYSVIPQFPLEIAVVEYCQDQSSSRLSQLEDDTSQKSSLKPQSKLGESSNASDPAKFGIRSAAQTLANTLPQKKAPREEVDKKVRQTSIAQRTGGPDKFLEELIEEVKAYNHSLAGVLRGCTLTEFNPPDVVLSTKYKFHKEKLEERKSLSEIERLASQLLGKKVKVQINIKNS